MCLDQGCLNLGRGEVAENLLHYAARHGIVSLLKCCLIQGVNASSRRNYALIWACAGNHHECVRLLLQAPLVNPAARWSAASYVCCLRGSRSCLELLLQDGRCDPSARYGNVLIAAAELGHAAMVDALIRHVAWNPDFLNAALVQASAAGHEGKKLVFLLLHRVLGPLRLS